MSESKELLDLTLGNLIGYNTLPFSQPQAVENLGCC